MRAAASQGRHLQYPCAHRQQPLTTEPVARTTGDGRNCLAVGGRRSASNFQKLYFVKDENRPCMISLFGFQKCGFQIWGKQ